MGKIALILISAVASVAALGTEGLNGLLGTQTQQRRGAFGNSLSNFNAATNPTSLNNYYQSPQQAFLSNLAQSTSQSMKLPERKDPSEITKQFEEGRKQAEESFKSTNEDLQKGLAEAGKLDELTKLLTKSDDESDSEIISNLSTLISAGRNIASTGTTASASTVIDMINAGAQTQIQSLLTRAQLQAQTLANQPAAVASTPVGNDFLLGIELVGASMASRNSGTPFTAAATLREQTDLAGTSDAFTPGGGSSSSADPHAGHNHGIGVPKTSAINADPRRGLVEPDLGKRTYNFPVDVFPQ